MKEQFPGYFRPTEKEFQELWTTSLIVLDTSVILKFYEYSKKTREEIFSVLKKYKNQLWLPHRVVDEVLHKRYKVISDQTKAYKSTIKEIKKIESDLIQSDKPPFVSTRLLKRFSLIVKNLVRELETSQGEHQNQISLDPILDNLVQLYDGRIGTGYTQEQIDKLCNEGKERYLRKIPPGYKDEDKSNPGNPTAGFGDLIIWKQILDKAMGEQCSVIFVLNDRKEDWWLIHDGETISPHPELIKEFKSKTGKGCYLYQSKAFFDYINEHKQKISKPALNELERLMQLERSDEVFFRNMMSLGDAQRNARLAQLQQRVADIRKELDAIALDSAFSHLLGKLPADDVNERFKNLTQERDAIETEIKQIQEGAIT